MTASHRHSPTRRLIAGRRAAGFTLMELLVVMGIIVLIAATAIPAFRFITGSRSVEGGQNIVNAMVGRARTQAVVTGQGAGVFFFVDPRDDRSKMALVQQGSSDSEYGGWASSSTSNPQPGPAAYAMPNITYYDQSNPDFGPSGALQMVQTMQAPPAPYKAELFNGGATTGAFVRLAAILFTCSKTHAPPSGTNIVQNVPIDSSSPSNTPYSNQYWNSNASNLELVRDVDFQMLPQGVAAAVVIDPLNPTLWNNNRNLGVDRYVRTGCVMFDGQGRFTSAPFDVTATSKLGQTLFLNQMTNGVAGSTPASLNGNGVLPLFSGFGVVLFDRQSLLADAKINGYTEGDYLYGNTETGKYYMPYTTPSGTPAPAGFGAPTAATAALEASKQQWLDNNALLLTATRYNGAMTRGE